MVQQWYSIGRIAVLVTAALLFSSGTSQAGGHGGGGGPGGGAGGHGWSGSGGGYHGGEGGYYHGGYYHGFYGFGLGVGLGYGLGFPWYYGDYNNGGNYPGYYDNGYDYPPPASSLGAYPDTGASAIAANQYSYQNPSVGTVPDSARRPDENAIYVRVQVPPNAEVWFEGQKTTQNGPVRFFQSPPLAPGREYVYHLRARWSQNGHEVNLLREVKVYAGDKFSIDFTKMLSAPMEKAPPPAPKEKPGG